MPAGHAEVLMCEGVFDFLTALAWDHPAFSTCGTYLPADRLGFLARASVVYAVFDPDAAGRSGDEVEPAVYAGNLGVVAAGRETIGMIAARFDRRS